MIKDKKIFVYFLGFVLMMLAGYAMAANIGEEIGRAHV